MTLNTVRLIASEEDLNTSICRLGFNFITFITQSNKSCRFDSCIVVKTKSEVYFCRLRPNFDLIDSFLSFDPLIYLDLNNKESSTILEKLPVHQFYKFIAVKNHIEMEYAISLIHSKTVSVASEVYIILELADSLEVHLILNYDRLLINNKILRLLKGKYLTRGARIQPVGTEHHPVTSIEILEWRSTNFKSELFLVDEASVYHLKRANTSPLTVSLTRKLGGLQQAYLELKELIQYPFLYRKFFDKLSLQCPKGALLCGPSGVGKTQLVRTVCELVIEGPTIFSPFFGETEQNLRRIFSLASESSKKGPTVLFIDEIDSLCPARDSASRLEGRVVATLLTLMDGFSGGQLCVLGATNNPAVIDSALRRPGRFDREIHMKQPDKSSRLSILNALLEHIPLDPSVNLDYVAGMCRGYSGADLNNLCLVTFHRGLSRHVSGQKNVSLSLADFVESMNKVPPSTLKEHMVDVDTLTWEHVGGLNDVIKVLEESVLHPLRHKERYSRFGLSAPKGVLLYGPPGCCKTTLVKILASLGEFSFFTLSGAQMFHSYVGEAERTISSMVKRALQSSPSLLFFDEIDIIGARRGDGDGVQERLLSTLLVEMDGVTVTGHVVFLGATNRISVLDSALIRPGRFDKLIHVPPPDLNARIEIFKVHTRNMKLSEGVDFFSLAKKTAGYTGADIENICREAAMSALRESLSDPLVTPEHFSETLCLLRPMTSFEKTEFYQK